MNRTIFAAAKLHALNPRGEQGNAMLVEDEQVRAIASVAELRAHAPDAEIVDFGAATITPGLIDSHIHLTEWALSRSHLDLADAPSIDAVVRRVASAQPHAGWIQGRGWNPHHWGGEYPTGAVLDAIVSDKPVCLQSHDMHALWLNRRALQVAGITSATPDPEGGRIVRDSSGEPTGVLLESAAQLAVPHLPRYDMAAILSLLESAQQQLHKYGIVGVHSFPGVHLLEPDPLSALQLMRERDQLRLRIVQHIALDRLDDAIRVGIRSGLGDDWLRIGGVKMFLDGALGSRTALMREPYEHSRDRGVEVMSRADFTDAVDLASRHGIASVVHAIGDEAVARAFDVLTRNPEAHTLRLPHRVEHVQCLPRECAPLLGKRVVCSVQPSHLMSDWRAADEHWGDRANDTYAFRFMLDNGAVLACGSDAPVESADPRHGLFAAVSRQDLHHEPRSGWHGEQRISAREVLAAYTTGPAFAAGIPATHAGIAPGALADFVAWRQDPLAIEPDALLHLTPVATVVGGKIVYRD